MTTITFFNQLTAMPKRLAMVLTVLFTIGVGSMWGETATNNCGSALSATATDMESGKLIQWKVSSTNSYNNPIRVYANTTITITAKSGVKRITQVEVTASSTGNYVTNTEGATWTASGNGTYTVGTKSVSGKVITVPMNGDVTTVTIKPSAQTRWSKVVVTYELDASCDKKVTLTKGLETNGTFTLDKANGSYDNCDENFVVKVSNITPKSASQYCSGINVTGGNSSVTGPVDGVWTVTYTKENNITSTITPIFANKASASIDFVNMGTPAPTTTGYYVGDTYTLPSENNFTCGDKNFVGWSTVTIDNSANKPTSNFYARGASVTLEANNTFYAVFAESGGTGTTTWPKTDIANINDGDEVVVVMNNSDNYALYDDNGTGSAPTATLVTITDNCVTTTSDVVPEELIWVLGKSNDGLIFYKDNNKDTWLYCTNTNNGVRVGTNTNKTFTIDASSGYLKHTGTSRYVGIYNSQDWRCYTGTSGTNIANQTLAFYAKTTTAGYQNYTTSCAAEPTYSVVLTKPSNGSISANLYENIKEGDKVNLTAEPNPGYKLSAWTVVRKDNSQSVTVTNNQFTMPASDVTVSATFVAIPKLATPTNLGASDITTTSATLIWEWNESTFEAQLQNYNVYIYDATGTNKLSGPVTATDKSLSTTKINGLTLSPGTTYKFKVVALSKNQAICLHSNESDWGTFTTSELPKYTVSFSTGTGNPTQASITESEGGAGITLPTGPAPTCTDWTFAGWAETSVTETTTAPTLLAAGDNYKPTSAITLHAVYSKTETTQGGGENIESSAIISWSESTLSFSGNGWNSNTSKGYSGNYLRLDENQQYVSYSASTGTVSQIKFTYKLQSSTACTGHKDQAWWIGDIELYGSINSGSSWSKIDSKCISVNSGDNLGKDISVTYNDLSSEGYNAIKIQFAKECGNLAIKGLSATSGGGSTTTTTYNSNPECCQQPKNPLTITADKTELVKNGIVQLTATGGNGRPITWSTPSGSLTNQSNTGATLTINDVATTQTITVTASQEKNDDDEPICEQKATIDITVKAQWTITFWTNDNGNKESNSMTVTDGESYTMPDISDEYVCNSGSSFAGWVDNEDDTELDATPNSTQTATANQTWYAAWSSSASTKTVDVYQLVTNVTNLAAGDKVWITNATPTVAMGVQNEKNRGQVTVTNHPTESDKIYSTGLPATLTIGKDGTNYTFHDGTGYLYAASSSSNHLKTKATLDANGKWSINITDEVASIVSQGTYTRNTIRYNKSNTPPLFSCYASGQSDVKIYKNVGTAEIEVSGASITTNNTSCHRGAVISAENGKWITSSKGQKVRIAINVTARGFESDATLSATSANEHFSVVSITNTTITKNSAFETQMMIEYQPAEANTNENAEITLVAKKGEEVVATRTIDVNGRSLPDEFVIVAQYGDKWLALPANMQSGADQYNGIEVTPNNTLTQIPAAPSTTIYSLRGVADNRYEAAGTCVRLVGNGNKCLWGNAANTNTTIQNWTTLASTNGSNYEWLLTTSDGELYTIANPAHPDYDEGRILSNSGSKYGLYKGTTKFYILPVGCSSQPGNIQVTARRVDATFSWEGNASSMTIDVYTNDAMTAVYISNTTTASPYYLTGLLESTQYWFRMTPNGTDDACAYTGTFKTTGPTIDVVEWQENAAVIFVDKDEELNPLVVIDGEVEHGVGGTKATDIFFSKYFEAQSEAKLLAIYNGTANAISLADITILQRGTKHSSTYDPLSLAPYGKTPGWIQPGEELILYNEDQSANSVDIMKCAESDPTFSNWVKVDNNNLAFSGKGTVRLFRGDKCIDIIGAMGSADDIHNIEITPLEGTEKPSFGDKEGFTTATGDNYSTDDVETNYTLSTNRCLLVRKPSVTSGAIAVEKNIGDFKTLGNDYDGIVNEWAGLQVPNGPSDNKYKYTCEGFQEVGSFDYNNYYKEYNNIDDDTYLESYTHNNATKEYTIPIENLANYSCLNIRFQLKQGDQVLTEEPVQVPIIVSDQKATNDAIFNAIVKTDGDLPVYDQSIERCKTCNVVVLSNATLTKAADGTENDVAQVQNIKMYPGATLVVPEGTKYTVNTLSLRRQEDTVSMANIQGALNIGQANGVYLDVRIDPTNWHYMTLPYDCRVGDITFADGTPAAVNTDYLLGWYDGAYRAEHKTGGWTYITDNDYILKKGLGYIVALPGDGKVRREIRFPMANDVIAEDLTGKTVSGLYAYGGDKTDAELRPNHKGWNMIGNPYLYTYTADIVKEPLQMGTLSKYGDPWDGSWERTGEARYIVEPIDNGWSGYRQTTITNLKPFTSYFIQVGGKKEGDDYTTVTPETNQSIVFNANSIARSPSSIVRRDTPAEEVEDNHPIWYGIELLAPNNEKDNTTLLISNNFTDGYDMMDDLVKMRGDYYQYYNYPVLASRNDEGEMAFNALPDNSAARVGVPLNYYAAVAGTYTITTDGRFDLEEVKSAILYDATTAQECDLLLEDYTFTTAKGNNSDRFTLFVTVERKKAPSIPTGKDNLLTDGQLSLITIDRTLVLSGLTDKADIYVYDMTGKLIIGARSSGDNGIWRTSVPTSGVYFVRVNGKTEAQTIKAVVK